MPQVHSFQPCGQVHHRHHQRQEVRGNDAYHEGSPSGQCLCLQPLPKEMCRSATVHAATCQSSAQKFHKSKCTGIKPVIADAAHLFSPHLRQGWKVPAGTDNVTMACLYLCACWTDMCNRCCRSSSRRPGTPVRSQRSALRRSQSMPAVASVPWVWPRAVLMVLSAVSSGRQLVCCLCMTLLVMTLERPFVVASRR